MKPKVATVWLGGCSGCHMSFLVANIEHEELAHIIRRNSRSVVSFGDCAVTGNVTAMRNAIDTEAVLHRSYVELSDINPHIPREYPTIAELMPQARPLHEFITVDAYIHGCPPTADQIWSAVSELLQGRMPALSHVYLRYG
jgi:NAD-reducing hydrogenase small subunit